MSKKASIFTIVILALVIGIASAACFCSFAIPNSVKDYKSIMSLINKGVDLSGGYYVVLTPEGEDSSDDVIQRAMTILRTRLDNKNYTEATISVQDMNKIRVEIPNVKNASEVLKVIGSTGELTFQDSSGYAWLTGDDIKSAYVSRDANGNYVCVLEFTNNGVAKFSEATAAISAMDSNVMNICLGDEIHASPTVSSQITSSSAQIEVKTYEQAEAIASVIESGRLPIAYAVSEARAISARLGETAVSKSLLAGGLGLLAIIVIMIIRYRGMGVAAGVALIIYTLLYVILLAIVPIIQLTLPGIAGILLSIGMAVDANVIIFERIREEYRSGKTLTTSLNSGFKRAVITVIDCNVLTIISSVILYFICPGAIKGFAVTLLIGIVLSLFTSIVVTRWLLKVMLPLSKKQDKLFNLKREEVAANA